MPIFKSRRPDLVIPTNLTLPEFITQHFSKFPADRKVLVEPHSNRSLTFTQLLDGVLKVAAGFHLRGLDKGEVVAIFSPNSIEYPMVLYGVQSLGAILSPINPLYTAEELQRQLTDCGAKYLVTVPQLMDTVKAAIKNINGQLSAVFVIGGALEGAISFESLINNDGKYPRPLIDPCNTVAVIPYSSGTTGLAKGVELTHYNIITNIMQVEDMETQTYSNTETLIGFLPFFHAYGMVFLIGMAFHKGFTLVVMPKFDLSLFLTYVQDFKITVAHVVPPVMVLLAKEGAVAGDKYDTSSIKVLVSGAAPLGAETEAQVKERMKNVVIKQGYGMTEMGPTTHITLENVSGPGSAGQLLANITAKIVDTETGKELGVGQTGELWVSGPNKMKGYLNNPSATNSTIDKDGFLHTGDIGYVDENGNYYIVDRLKELIKYRGFQVAPAELEALLLTHPSIADVAVIGKSDAEAGELPMAFVVLKSDRSITEKEIVEWAEKKVAPHKKLRGGVAVVNVIPKSASGKILRRLLRSRL